MPVDRYLLDTNILLRLVQTDSPDHAMIRLTVDGLWERGAELFYTSQNLGEFWNVCTRPAERNGFGFSVAETNLRAGLIESCLSLVPEGELIHREWRKMLVEDRVSGVQVHDARLVAAMRVHGIGKMLTLNGKDFRRYRQIEAVSPTNILLV